MTTHLYISNEPFAYQPVKPKATSTAGKLIAAYEAAEGDERDALAVKARGPFKFVPIVKDGATANITRYTLDDDTFNAWHAAKGAARTAILAKCTDTLTTASAIHPSIVGYASFRAGVAARAPEGRGRERFTSTLLAELAAGIVILPQTGRGASAKVAKLSAAERTALAVDAMFADEPTSAELDALDALQEEAQNAEANASAPIAE